MKREKSKVYAAVSFGLATMVAIVTIATLFGEVSGTTALGAIVVGFWAGMGVLSALDVLAPAEETAGVMQKEIA